MRKIPVLASVARAYAFGVGSFTRALAVAWLPYALVFVLAWFLLAQPAGSLLRGFLAMAPGALPELGGIGREKYAEHLALELLSAYAEFYRLSIAFFLTSLLLQSIAAVGLTRASKGLDGNGSLFYFSLGKPVWKLFGAWLATYLILSAAGIVLLVSAIAICVIVGVALAQISWLAALLLCVAAVLAAILIGVWINIRLNFFLPAIIVSEKKLDILRSWTLSKGNVWRILGIYIALLPPLLALAVAVSFVKVIAVFALVPHWFDGIGKLFTGWRDWEIYSAIAQNMLPLLPVLIVVSFLLYVMFSAMLYAATARAYHGLAATEIASQTERS